MYVIFSPRIFGVLRVLEWVAISFSRESSRPRDWTLVSHIVDRCFIVLSTREVQGLWTMTCEMSQGLSKNVMTHGCRAVAERCCTNALIFFLITSQLFWEYDQKGVVVKEEANVKRSHLLPLTHYSKPGLNCCSNFSQEWRFVQQ